jgi:hypothetical protein
MFEGYVPDEPKVQKICGWPEPTNQTQVHGFLGTFSVLCIFICDFSYTACHLINLTKKDAPFKFGAEQCEAMQILKDSVLSSPVPRCLDYKSEHKVILVVDTSNIAIGYILLQVGKDSKHYPNCFGSTTLNEVESHFSQAKLELFGLFCALHAVHIFIFGVKNLTVEVDVKYIKGMINNPDLHTNATINQWIVEILLFSFKLVHVSALKHKGIDGLSRRLPIAENLEEDDNHKDWIDHAHPFAIALLNDRTYCISGMFVDIVHEVHNTSYPSQTTCMPILHMYFNIACMEEDRPDILHSEKVRMHRAIPHYMQEALRSY